MTWWEWALTGAATYLMGGLITSRYMLFSLQDGNGKMRYYMSEDGRRQYATVGWPLLAGIFWPPVAAWYVVAAVVVGICMAGSVAAPLGHWWYTKPAVRKARAHGQIERAA